jgi:hypothetical protein
MNCGKCSGKINMEDTCWWCERLMCPACYKDLKYCSDECKAKDEQMDKLYEKYREAEEAYFWKCRAREKEAKGNKLNERKE